MSDPSSTPLHVMAGVLRDAQGRVLLAQRPPGKHLAGFWEFPGGKLESGELPQQALRRELREELGIQVDAADGVPLIRIPWCHEGGAQLLLDAWQFTRWQGTPASLEGQALQWVLPAEADPSLLAPADRPILQALRLPAVYAITPAEVVPDDFDAWYVRISAAFKQGTRLIELRFPLWSIEQVRALAARLQAEAVQANAHLLLNSDIDGAFKLGAGVGVHVTAVQLGELTERPLPWTQLVGASCHHALELAAAMRVADFATLSPVASTQSHPQAAPLGWLAFQALAASAALPVYALGGLTPLQAEEARRHGGQGVAGIRAFW